MFSWQKLILTDNDSDIMRGTAEESWFWWDSWFSWSYLMEEPNWNIWHSCLLTIFSIGWNCQWFKPIAQEIRLCNSLDSKKEAEQLWSMHDTNKAPIQFLQATLSFLRITWLPYLASVWYRKRSIWLKNYQ